MPAISDTRTDPGDDALEGLARQLHDAVERTRSGNGHDSSAERNRRIAIDAGVAILAEASAGTAEHSDDVVLITQAIGQSLGITGDGASDLLAAARLHDIGKAWVPAALLEKPGPLTDEEWEVMRKHTVAGERILASIEGLKEVGRLVRHSHERWDGGGYPDGLAGSDIPLGSRIIFCADAFHAIRSDRPYRVGRSAREAVAEINRCSGTQFDPRVAGALERVVRERSRRPRGAGSSRLLALLMCLVVGGAGTAIARSGLLQEIPTHPAVVSHATSPNGCGTAACPGVAAPVGGLNAVGGPLGVPGPRPVSPGLPGQGHGRKHGHRGKAGAHPGNASGAHQNHGNHGRGNRGKSAAAHAAHGTHGQGNGAGGQSSGSSGTSHADSSSGSSGSSGGHSSGHSGSSHGGSSHAPSHGSSSHGSSHGSASHGGGSHGAGGSGGGGSQGNGGGNGNGK